MGLGLLFPSCRSLTFRLISASGKRPNFDSGMRPKQSKLSYGPSTSKFSFIGCPTRVCDGVVCVEVLDFHFKPNSKYAPSLVVCY